MPSRCGGSATHLARRLQFPSQLSVQTKYSSTSHSNFPSFFQPILLTKFPFTHILSAFFLSDLVSFYNAMTLRNSLANQFIQQLKDNSSFTAGKFCYCVFLLYSIFLHSLITYLTDRHDFSRTTYRQSDGLNHFGHLGLHWGLIRDGLGTHSRH